MSKMTAEQEKGIFKAAVVVNDEAGLPNYMTMFYMGTGRRLRRCLYRSIQTQ